MIVDLQTVLEVTTELDIINLCCVAEGQFGRNLIEFAGEVLLA